MVRQIILASFVVILPAGLQAQGRGMAMPVSRAVSAAPRAGAPVAHVGSARTMVATRVSVRGGAVRSRTATPIVRGTRRVSAPSRFANNRIGVRPNCRPAPGLGFDESHLAAVCGPGAFGGRRGAFQYPFYFPFYEGGFYVPGTSAGVDESTAAETGEQDSADTDVRDSGWRYRNAQSAPAPMADTASAGPADNDEFVFVRRDGTVFFAVAYSWEKGTLRYITSEGLRHSVMQDALDLGATQQFNEQRGLNFRLPA